MADDPSPGRLVDHALELDFGDGPEMRLSAFRVALVLVILVGVAALGTVAVRNALASVPKLTQTVAIPYVDVTNTPLYNFQDPTQNPNGKIALGFVVAAKKNQCTPSWGGAYSLESAEESIDLTRRLEQYRSIGGIPIVSFGGRNGTDLAVACSTPGALQLAYSEVLSYYGGNEMDLDIEGATVANTAALDRQATALAALQAAAHATKKPLSVWMTLPVGPDGLTPGGLHAVNIFLSHHVHLSGVNALAMDFGSPLGGNAMLSTIESSLNGTASQVAAAYAAHGTSLSTAQAWNHLGATVMIGQNDSPGEVVTIGDFLNLMSFFSQNRIGRISFWSLNRDSACGTSFPLIGVHSTTCSGVAQRTLQFSTILHAYRGASSSSFSPVSSTPTTVPSSVAGPYPTWQSQVPYATGYKVVWQGMVYEARFYSQGIAPDTPEQYAWQSAWELVGPVLRGETTPTVTTLPTGTDPAWSPLVTYSLGSVVLYKGLPYEAQFSNQNAIPGAVTDTGQASPWKPLWNYPNEPSEAGGGG